MRRRRRRGLRRRRPTPGRRRVRAPRAGKRARSRSRRESRRPVAGSRRLGARRDVVGDYLGRRSAIFSQLCLSNCRLSLARKIEVPGAGSPRPADDFAGRRSLGRSAASVFLEGTSAPILKRLQEAPCGATLEVPAARFTRAGLVCCASRAWQQSARPTRRAFRKPARHKAPPPGIMFPGFRSLFSSGVIDAIRGLGGRPGLGRRDFAFSESLPPTKAPPRSGVARKRESRQSPRTQCASHCRADGGRRLHQQNCEQIV
jgi:hypothetical protein